MIFSSKKPDRIDTRIETLQSQLTELYEERLSVIEPNPAQLSIDMVRNPWEIIETAQILRSKWIEREYQRLEIIWGLYDINIPTLAKLKLPLTKCHKVISELSQARPELKDKLEIVLVPPSRRMTFPVKEQFRQNQVYVTGRDQVVYGFPKVAPAKTWKLVVVYNYPDGLYLGVPNKIITEKHYLIAGHDTRGLGANEYLAFSLQQGKPFDSDTWTLLMKDSQNSSQLVPIAGLRDGAFKFDIDELTSVFGDIRFRPAVEIQGVKI